MAVRDGLAPAGEIRLDAYGGPAAIARHTEAAADVVDHEHGASLVCEFAAAHGKVARGQELVLEDIMPEGRDEDGGEIVACGFHGLFETRGVVIGAEVLGGAFARRDASGAWVRPRLRAVIGARRTHDAIAFRLCSGGHEGDGGGVRAVLAEHGPVGVGDHAGEGFSQFDHGGAGAGERIASAHLVGVGCVDAGMAVAEQLRAIGAHEVEIAVAVDVPHPRAFGAREELRIAFREGGC